MKFTLTSFFVVFMFLAPNTAFTKMAADASFGAPLPKTPVSVSEIVQHYTKKQQQKKLNESEITLLNLSVLAKDAFDVKNIFITRSPSQDKDKFEFITAGHLVSAIKEMVNSKTNWDDKLSDEKTEIFKKNIDFIKNNLGGSDASWAWVQYQMGSKAEAKSILSKIFSTSYETIMNMKHVYNHNNSPLQNSETWNNILKPMSTDSENKERDEQIKKMRTHISTLPDMMIMT